MNNNDKVIYKNTSHFSDWLENTKDVKSQQYTEEQFSSDFSKWVEDEKYSKGQMNSNEKYFLQKWISEISKKKE